MTEMGLRGKVDRDGRLVLDPEDTRRHGLAPGAEFFVESSPDGLVVVRPTPEGYYFPEHVSIA